MVNWFPRGVSDSATCNHARIFIRRLLTAAKRIHARVYYRWASTAGWPGQCPRGCRVGPAPPARCPPSCSGSQLAAPANKQSIFFKWVHPKNQRYFYSSSLWYVTGYHLIKYFLLLHFSQFLERLGLPLTERLAWRGGSGNGIWRWPGCCPCSCCSCCGTTAPAYNIMVARTFHTVNIVSGSRSLSFG